ncbi:MAG TPA: YafY family protein [Myxococcales bacterium]
MRRADRLFRIVQRLRRRGATTARDLAQALEVSERTVYRDVRDLCLSGVPIQGEAGVGYALDRSYELPPLMFDEEEIEALVLGARIVRAWADQKLARAAEEALQKIEAVLPPRLKSRLADTALMAPDFHVSARLRNGLEDLRHAIRDQRKAKFRYVDKAQAGSERTVHPLGLAYWGQTWTLTAWCELRQGFRNFRLDRIEDLIVTAEPFEKVPGRTLADFLAQMEAEERGGRKLPSRAPG